MAKALTKRQSEFIERSIKLQDPSSDEYKKVVFWARALVQASLPHSNPGNVPVFGRENGRFSLSIQPGMYIKDGKEVNVGIPYGPIPRLLLSWMCTEAVRTKDPKLILGDSLASFMEEVGIGRATGGRWGSITRLRTQMEKLFEARISYRWLGTRGKARRSMSVADEEVIWWDNRSPHQSACFRSYVVLSPEFFEEVTTNPVPIKLEALKLLKQSSLALDLYDWFTYRVYRLNEPVFVSWSQLQKQFGANYKSQDAFARKCREYIRKIEVVYPELNVRTHTGRLEIRPSPTHVVAVK